MTVGRSPDAVVEARVRRLYRRQLDGLSARALVYDHADKEQVSIKTAWRDWAAVKQLVDEDWKNDRENMLARLQHMRTKLFHQALKKGNCKRQRKCSTPLVVSSVSPLKPSISKRLN